MTTQVWFPSLLFSIRTRKPTDQSLVGYMLSLTTQLLNLTCPVEPWLPQILGLLIFTGTCTQVILEAFSPGLFNVHLKESNGSLT